MARSVQNDGPEAVRENGAKDAIEGEFSEKRRRMRQTRPAVREQPITGSPAPCTEDGGASRMTGASEPTRKPP